MRVAAPAVAGFLALSLAPSPLNRVHAQDSPSGQSSQAGDASKAVEKAKTEKAPGQMFSSYEGQKVSTVALAGQPNMDLSSLKAGLAQKPGETFSEEKVTASAATLKASGRFTDVRVQVDPESDGVRVTYILEPAVYIGVFGFPGAKQFTYSRMIQVANYPVQTPYDPDQIERDRQSLLQFFRQTGYFQADVQTKVQVDSAHAVANIDFAVTLGRRAKFGEVDISGVPASEKEHLQASIKSLLARLRTAAVRPGKAYHRATLTKAATYLQTELQRKGLLNAQVTLAGAEYHADTNRADIHFAIVEGPNIKVKIEGARLWPWTRKSLLPVYQGIGVDDESVQEGRQALVSYFQSKGYFDVNVDAHLDQAGARDVILYQINKQKKHKVKDVAITGNTHIPSSQLTPHLKVEEKHLFSAGKFSDQLVQASVNNLKAVYQSEGYSDVAVVPSVTNRSGDIHVSFRVVEGERDVVSSLKVEGADTFPASQYAPGGMKLAVGQPYSQAHVAQDRASIMANYLKAGYLNSSFRETATEISKKDPHHIDVTYHIFEGPRVLTGDVLTLGRTRTSPRLVQGDIAALKTGEPLTETNLLTAGSRLYDHTGVFDWAEVDPKRQITTQTNEDVLVKVHEAKKNDITYGFGFEIINRGGSVPSGTVALPNLPPVGLPSNFKTSQTTFYGPRGTFQYTRNNFRGKGESISVTAFAGRLDQRGAFYYINPSFRWTPWRATTSFSAESNEENPIFSSQQELGSFQLQRFLDKELKNTVFLRYQFSQTNITKVLIDALVPQEDRNVQLSTVAANFTRDTRDNVLDEHHGIIGSSELDLNTTKLGSSVNFAKYTGQFAFFTQKFHNIVWANSIRVGLAQPFANSRVPLSERFFSGGGNSLRGFPLDGAGPQRQVLICPNGETTCANSAIYVPNGGNELLILNAEARIPVPLKKGLSVVPFYDGGNVFPRVGFHDFTSLYSNSVGAGLRYATPVGPVRVDLGYNLNNTVQGVSSFQYFVSIGQAF